jgi:hypothetical protein
MRINDDTAKARAEAGNGEYVLTAGIYYGGEDIPAGEYDMVWISGDGSFHMYGVNGNKASHSIKTTPGGKSSYSRSLSINKDDKIVIEDEYTAKFMVMERF